LDRWGNVCDREAIPITDAKEVGVKNPAEETSCYRDLLQFTPAGRAVNRFLPDIHGQVTDLFRNILSPFDFT